MFGSAQTRSGGGAAGDTDGQAVPDTRQTTQTEARLQTEDIDRASCRRVLLDVLHRADDAERRVRIVGGDSGNATAPIQPPMPE